MHRTGLLDIRQQHDLLREAVAPQSLSEDLQRIRDNCRFVIVAMDIIDQPEQFHIAVLDRLKTEQGMIDGAETGRGHQDEREGTGLSS